MNQRWAKTGIILGLSVLLIDGLFAYLKIQTELKFVDLTSGNPRWVRPVPTWFDNFVLGVPLGTLLILALVLLAVGYAGTRYGKRK